MFGSSALVDRRMNPPPTSSAPTQKSRRRTLAVMTYSYWTASRAGLRIQRTASANRVSSALEDSSSGADKHRTMTSAMAYLELIKFRYHVTFLTVVFAALIF